jgi:DNA (cytosine-5)-methyltransferase 1
VIIADDLFAGAGGWDLAAADLGIHARGVENMKEARATREAAGLETIHDDVWTFEPDGKASGLIASPPCQTFSAAGKGTGRQALDDVLHAIRVQDYTTVARLRECGDAYGDERTALVLTPLHFATQYPYEWLAWEQVPTVLPVWEACAEVLRAEGWNVWTGLLHSEQYGVPQTRKRAFLLASRHSEVSPPTPTHSRYHSRSPERLDEDVLPWVSMARALGWGLGERPSPTITGGGTETGGAEPIAKLARYTDRPDWQQGNQRNGGSTEYQRRSVDSPSKTITGLVRSFNWITEPVPAIEGDTVEDVTWVHDRPSPTIVGSYHPEVVAKPGYRKAGDPPRQKTPGSVRVTVEEAGVLQSFPADYPWQGKSGKQYLQCGNSVPPGLARAALSTVVPAAAQERAA